MYQYIVEVLQLDPPDVLAAGGGNSARCVAVRCEKRGATCYYDHVNARCTVRMAPAEDDLQLSLRLLERSKDAATMTPGAVLACAAEALHVGGAFNHIGACWVTLYPRQGSPASGNARRTSEDKPPPCRVRVMWEVLPEKEAWAGRVGDVRRSSERASVRLSEIVHEYCPSPSPPPTSLERGCVRTPCIATHHALHSRRGSRRDKSGSHESRPRGNSRDGGRRSGRDHGVTAIDAHVATQATGGLVVQGCAASTTVTASRTRTLVAGDGKLPSQVRFRGVRTSRPPSPLPAELRSNAVMSHLSSPHTPVLATKTVLPKADTGPAAAMSSKRVAETRSSETPRCATKTPLEPASVPHEGPLRSGTTSITVAAEAAPAPCSAVHTTDDELARHAACATHAPEQQRIDLFATSTQLRVPPEIAYGNLYTAPCPTLLLQLLAKARLASGDKDSSSGDGATSEEEEKLLRAWQLPLRNPFSLNHQQWCAGSALQAIRNDLHNPANAAVVKNEKRDAVATQGAHDEATSLTHDKDSLFSLTEEEQATMAMRAALDRALRACGVLKRYVSHPTA